MIIIKITLIINRKTRDKICEEYYNKQIDLEKSIIKNSQNLRIVYKSGSFFGHEMVEEIEPLEKYGLKITTTKKIWYLY